MKNWLWHRERGEEFEKWVHPWDLNVDTLPRPIVVINGTFDLLHSGHLRLISAAVEKRDGGTVLMLVDGDKMVREKKGEGRPILAWEERAAALQWLPVDYLVEISSDNEMIDIMKKLRPELRVQGGDYVNRPTRFPWLKTMYVPRRGISTSEIIRRIRERNKQS